MGCDRWNLANASLMGSLPLFNPESRHKFFFHQFANPAIEVPMAHLRDKTPWYDDYPIFSFEVWRCRTSCRLLKADDPYETHIGPMVTEKNHSTLKKFSHFNQLGTYTPLGFGKIRPIGKGKASTQKYLLEGNMLVSWRGRLQHGKIKDWKPQSLGALVQMIFRMSISGDF